MKDSNAGNYVGIVLAAGLGSRLRPMTNSRPKCMVKTAGKSILEYQIDAYKKAGVNKLVIVVGYEAAAVKQFCKHVSGIEIIIVENEDYENTNNMYSFYLAAQHVKGSAFILNNADLAIDDDIIEKMISSPHESAIAVDTSQYIEESMKISVNDEGFISDISKKIQPENSAGCSIDFYKFSSTDGKIFIDVVTNIIKKEKNLKDWTEVAMQRAFNNQTLKFRPFDIGKTRWVEIDNFDDLALADRVFSGFDVHLQKIKAIFFDLDGTVYVGNNVVPGAIDAIENLKKAGKKVFFLTNNSSKNKNDYLKKLHNLGLKADEDEVILSTDGVLDYLKRNEVSNIHILGTESMKNVFKEAGFNVDSNDPTYVVLGYDTELNYQKLITACTFLNKGVELLATHCDNFCPSEVGPIPDIGSMLAMLEVTTGVKALKVFGKPNKEMVDHILTRFSLRPDETMFVGDRLHTDMTIAKNLGGKGLLVLTGETPRDALQESEIQPDFVLKSVKEIH